MNYTIDKRENSLVAVVESDRPVIMTAQDALDLTGTIGYEHRCNKIVLPKAALSEDFFVLRTCLAGDVLQKFVNYHVHVAIVGDFSIYESKSLRDFIYECNKGRHVFFLSDIQTALDALHAL